MKLRPLANSQKSSCHCAHTTHVISSTLAFGGYKSRRDVPKLVEKYQAGTTKLDDYVTHTMHFDEINKVRIRARAMSGLRWRSIGPAHAWVEGKGGGFNIVAFLTRSV